MEKCMPWLVALFIGTLSAVVNFYIGNRLRKSNETNIEKQHRQQWLTELRDAISEFLSISIHLDMNGNSIEHTRKYLERITYTKYRIEIILTNPQKQEQQKLLNAMENLIARLAEKTVDSTKSTDGLRNEIITAARELFSIHWKKLKN